MSNGYQNNPNLPREGYVHTFTQHEYDEFIKCMNDPVYFAMNYMKIVNVDHGLMPFKMWDFQQDMLKSFHNNRFNICKLPRQVGKCFINTTEITVKDGNNSVYKTTVGELYEKQSKRSRKIDKNQSEKIFQPEGRNRLREVSLLHDNVSGLNQSCEKNTWNTTSGIFKNISFKKSELSQSAIRQNIWKEQSGLSTWWQIFTMVRKLYSQESRYRTIKTKSQNQQTNIEQRQYQNRVLARKDQWRFIKSTRTSLTETVNIFLTKMYSQTWSGKGHGNLVSETVQMDEKFQKTKLFQNITEIISFYYGKLFFRNGIFCGTRQIGYAELQEQRISTQAKKWKNGFTRLYRFGKKENNRIQRNLLAWSGEIESEKRNREGNRNKKFWLFDIRGKRKRLQTKSESNTTGMPRLSEQIERKFIDSIQLDDLQILTDNGWKPATFLHKTVKYEEWILKTDSHNLTCADDHIVFLSDGSEIFVKNLNPGDIILTENGTEKVISVNNTKKQSHMYDITVDSNDHRFYTNGILSHNTTVSVAYLLHYILFNMDVNCAILANKLGTAREIMGRLQLAFEYLPPFLKQGVRQWNKSSIELANGSRIVADSTSGSSVRGKTFNIIFLDEFAFVPENIAEAFFNSTYPTISSGKTTKVIIVSTPNGLNLFYNLWTKAIEKKNEYVPIEVHWSMVPGRDEEWKETTIRNTSLEQWRQEFECVSGDSLVDILDENGKENTMRMSELYSKLSS